MFVDVSENTGCDLCAIKGAFESGDMIQIFDKDGNSAITLTWKTRKGNTGWHDEDNVYYTKYMLDPGKSAWFYTASTMNVVQSGQVNNKSFTLTLGQKFNQTGNPTPVTLKLNQFTFDGLVSGDMIQIFDSDGNTTTTYTWKTRKGNTGWHNEDNEYIPDEPIAAGQAFWVYCANAGVKMTIPAVL